MTEGEKMVWAAVWGSGYAEVISNPPHHVMNNETEWARWEREQLATLAERATHAVRGMWDVLPEVKEGFGPDSDVYEMLAEMREASRIRLTGTNLFDLKTRLQKKEKKGP